MLKSIQKFFKQPSEAKDQEEMKQQDSQPNLAAPEMVAQLAAALEQNAKLAADMQALTELVEELSAQSEGAKAALAKAEADKAALAQEAATKRLAARKQAIEAAVGTSKAAELLAATESLGDEQFNAIVSAMAASFDAEAKSPMFQEKGVAAEASPQEEVSTVKKLAAAIEAELNPK